MIPYGEDLLQGVQTRLEAAQFLTPKSLHGANEDEVAGLWDGNVGIKAFLRRCVKAANMEEASPQKVLAAISEPNSGYAKEDMQEIFGMGGSAEAVAAAFERARARAAPHNSGYVAVEGNLAGPSALLPSRPASVAGHVG